MLPARLPPPQASHRRLRALHIGAAMALVMPAMAQAQDGAAPGVEPAEPQTEETLAPRPGEGLPVPPPPEAPEFNAAGDRIIAFEADSVAYDNDGDTVSASGAVLLRSGDQSVRADEVSWNRNTGLIVATGNVRLVDADGNQLFTDRVELTDELRAGAMENLLLALRAGGRLAAERGERSENGGIILTRAAYSGCAVADADGCPKDPSWRITADRVVYDAESKTIRFRGAYLEIFGLRVLPLVALSLRTDGNASSGYLVPDLGYSESNGVD
jgi:LPS-assembly protein